VGITNVSVKATIRDTLAVGNGAGFQAITSVPGASAEMNLENCVAANNSTGIASTGTGGALTRVSNSTITNNNTGLFPLGGALLSRLNNTVEGNTTNGNFTGTFTAK